MPGCIWGKGDMQTNMTTEAVNQSDRRGRAAGLNRRQLLLAGAPLVLTAVGLANGRASAAQSDASLGPPQPFDFEKLRQAAKALAAKSYVPPKPIAPDVVSKIDFDVVQKIKFRPGKSLFDNGADPFPVRLFHVDKFNPLPVRINVMSGGMARRVIYSPEDFDYGDTGLAQKLPKELGFSGFRVMNGPASKIDWLAFQGASYFRSAGEDNQYGASARGIAVDTTASAKEEFPRFEEFWLAEPDPHQPSITIYALLNGPSLTGAYQLHRGKAHRRHHAGDDRTVHPQRHRPARHRAAHQHVLVWGKRPAIRDRLAAGNPRQRRLGAVDGQGRAHLAAAHRSAIGADQFVPRRKPQRLRPDAARPQVRGLSGRRRLLQPAAEHLGGAAGQLGGGAVQLVEIPTQDEIHDNIVVLWKPKRPVKAGDNIKFAYRLYWQNDNPFPPSDIGRVTATRIGRGGVPGKTAPTDKDSWKFVIDFAGGPLTGMKPRYDIEPIVNASRGKISNAYVIKVVGTERWRVAFDVHAPGKKQIDLRCFLRLDNKTLTETWLYQFFPPNGAA